MWKVVRTKPKKMEMEKTMTRKFRRRKRKRYVPNLRLTFAGSVPLRDLAKWKSISTTPTCISTETRSLVTFT